MVKVANKLDFAFFKKVLTKATKASKEFSMQDMLQKKVNENWYLKLIFVPG